MKYPILQLRAGDANRVRSGHPWIYRRSLQPLETPPPDGAWVEVVDQRQRFLGRGFWHNTSKIAVRLMTHHRNEPDAVFWRQKIQAAITYRKRVMPNATSLRLISSEADGLSGLIVDRYESNLVLQITAAGMEQHRPLILAALKDFVKPDCIVERNDVRAREFEGLTQSKGVLHGELAKPVETQLGGLTIAMDLLEGHKTGGYLDQQLNHTSVAAHCEGKRVLDCFTFQGGFALHAAKAGASEVLGLDQSEEAVAQARTNATANHLEASFETANVFDWLKRNSGKEPREFDVVILDPPSFTRNRASVPDALRGYKEIHLRALRLLSPGGMLATFCCSHHVDDDLFLDTILSAAADARRVLRLKETYRQSPDHPIIPAIRETEYLKGFLLEVLP
ncbi:MAG: class I SAM-dependent rRNA methyltransferase [Verrucomicrobia subdivision 3 bacterium]|nr:class I SAM-dependent rRNA methyltransferase [Limisphaerales bacterium]